MPEETNEHPVRDEARDEHYQDDLVSDEGLLAPVGAVVQPGTADSLLHRRRYYVCFLLCS